MTANPPLTLSTAPLEHPALDYAFLRQEGIQWLERLAGPEWTDFNTHDPGITILEQLCYALTDLGHRIAYDLPDLLSSAGEAGYNSLYGPAQLLTTQPVTLEDLRKLVIDVEGVKNAWVESVTDALPLFSVEAATGALHLQATPATDTVQLRGLYRVLIELSDLLYLDSTVNHALIRRQVAHRLHANRSVGEDFAEIQVLDPEQIQVQARVEIAAVGDAAAILLAIYQRLADHISPPVRFTSLRDQLAAGKPVDEIFAGPLLTHGFIEREELRQAQRRTALRTSDLIREIMAVPGVRAVRTIRIAAGGGAFQPWSLDLALDKAPKLDLIHTEIHLERNGLPAGVNREQVQAAYKTHLRHMATAHQPAPAEQELPLPRGRDRHIGNYYSIQHQFPAIYGIGALGLPASASPQRQAQAQQLKAYLLFFDQLLANSFAQLAHAPELLAFSGSSVQTYFAQAIDDPRLGLEDIRRTPLAVHQATLQQITENPTSGTGTDSANSALRRRDRFLNHLLARFAEPLLDYSLLHTSLDTAGAVPLAKLVEDKEHFLQEYPALSGGRGRGFTYLQPWSSANRSGLEERIARKLGLMAAAGERFCLVEHILLRPLPEDVPKAGLGDASARVPLMTVANPQHPDPYSLQITFVFPQAPPRFQDRGFKEFIERTVREETPAHLVATLLWLDSTAMTALETAYQAWMDKLRSYWLEKLGGMPTDL